jgi:hypothetical protein
MIKQFLISSWLVWIRIRGILKRAASLVEMKAEVKTKT